MLADVRARVAAAVAARENKAPAEPQAPLRHHSSEVRVVRSVPALLVVH